MADAPATFGNDIFRQFLIERGYQQTLKAFENEIKDDKKRGIRVSVVVEKLRHAVLYSDINQMLETWRFLEANIFKWLEASKIQAATTFKHELYRWYLVAAAQNRRSEKITEFFEHLAHELQRSQDWSDWFAFPYTKSPQDNPKFSMYFQRTWVELYQLSLKNFLMLALNSSAYPQVVQQLAAMLRHMHYLDNENKVLRKKLTEGGHEVPEPTPMPAISPVEAKDTRNLMRERMDEIDEDFDNAKYEEDSSRPDPKVQPAGALGLTTPEARSAVPQARGGGIVSSVMRKFSKTSNAAASAAGPAAHATAGVSRRISNNTGVGPRISAPVVGNRLTGHPSDEEEAAATSGLSGDSATTEWLLQRGLSITKQHTFTEHRSMINHCRFNPSGHIVASLELEGAVKFWTVQPIFNTLVTLTARSTFLGLDWIPKGPEDRILLSTKTGQVRLYDLTQKNYIKDATVTAENNLHPRVHLVKCSPNGGKFILGAMSHQSASTSTPTVPSRPPEPSAQQNMQRRGRLAVWDLATMRSEGELTVGPEDSAPANACAVTADDGLVLAGCADGYLRVYDLNTWTLVKQAHAHPSAECLSVLLSLDGRSCYSLGTDGRLAAWTLPDLRPIVTPPLPTMHSGVAGPFELTRIGGYKQVLHVPRGQIITLGPDGRSLLTCASQGVKIYDMQRSGMPGESVQGISCGHRAPVVSLDWHWTSTGIVILSACMEGSIVASFSSRSFV